MKTRRLRNAWKEILDLVKPNDTPREISHQTKITPRSKYWISADAFHFQLRVQPTLASTHHLFITPAIHRKLLDLHSNYDDIFYQIAYTRRIHSCTILYRVQISCLTISPPHLPPPRLQVETNTNSRQSSTKGFMSKRISSEVYHIRGRSYSPLSYEYFEAYQVQCKSELRTNTYRVQLLLHHIPSVCEGSGMDQRQLDAGSISIIVYQTTPRNTSRRMALYGGRGTLHRD